MVSLSDSGASKTCRRVGVGAVTDGGKGKGAMGEVCDRVSGVMVGELALSLLLGAGWDMSRTSQSKKTKRWIGI